MKREYPDRPLIGVGAIIIKGDRALLVKRAHEPLKGEWSIPGGMLELGETLAAGVRREAREETGYDVEVGEVLEVFDRIVPDADGKTKYHYVLIDHLCRIVGGAECCGGDAAELRWISRDELATFPIADSAAHVLKKGFARARQR